MFLYLLFTIKRDVNCAYNSQNLLVSQEICSFLTKLPLNIFFLSRVGFLMCNVVARVILLKNLWSTGCGA